MSDKVDFIERYVSLLSGNENDLPGVTDAPRDFQEAVALFLVSTAAGRKFYFMSAPEANLYNHTGGTVGKTLNMWFILLGKSRVARKSVTVSKAVDALRELNSDLLLPQDFTPSALVKVLASRPPGSVSCWVNDEISSFFEKLRQGDYMTSTDTVLSVIYDCRNYRRDTISRQVEQIESPYLTCLLASTYILPTMFDENRIQQGFLNRFIYVLGDRTVWRPTRSMLTQRELDEADELMTWMRALSEMSVSAPILMTYNADARARFDEFEQRIEEKIMDGVHPLLEGYLGNIPNFVIKLSSLFRLSRLDVSYFQTDPTAIRPFLEIEQQDLVRAIDYADKVWQWFNRVVELMRRPRESRVPKREENLLLFVETTIKEHGTKNVVTGTMEIDRTDLSRYTLLSKRDLDNAVSLLSEQGRIRIDIRGQGRGRRRTVYVLTS